MKNITYKNFIKIVFYLSIAFNILLAKQESNVYFDRSIANYNFFPELKNPFPINSNDFLIVHNYRPKITNNKIKSDMKIGLNPNTFISYEQYDDNNILIPTVVTIDYYKERMIYNNNNNLMKNQAINNFKSTEKSIENRYGNKLTLLNRNIAGTEVAINVKGNIDIKGELEFVDSDNVTTSNQNQESWSLDIEQKQQFDLEGKIGDRFTISAEQNSQSDFEWENSLLLEYDGYDNEIVQNISAGNIGLSLPHTQLVSVGLGKREGLFGIKMLNQLGPLNLHTIVGKEQVKKESFSIGDQSEEGLIIYDYQFIKDKYFFIDEIFKLNYYPLNSNKNHLFDANYVIDEFKLFKRATANQIQTGWYPGTAYLDPNDLTEGQKEEGHWIELDDVSVIGGNKDYHIDKKTGVVRLNTTTTTDLIAVHYTIGVFDPLTNTIVPSTSQNSISTGTDVSVVLNNLGGSNPDLCVNETNDCENLSLVVCDDIDNITPCNENNDIGCCDYLNNDGVPGYQSSEIILKIIKTNGSQTTASDTWDLMLKNVYDIGSSNFTIENPPEIEIIHVGGQLGTETASSNGNTFLNIFGLDSVCGSYPGEPCDYGDGILDFDPVLVNAYGDLFLPFHMPFSFDSSDEPNYEINGAQSANPFYWGNKHPDLENIFDGVFGDSQDKTISLQDDEGNSLLQYQYYEYNNGPSMYYSDLQSNITSQREFAIKVLNSSQSTNINLGFMIVDGSETVMLSGETLTKGIDYSIDYFSGTLTLVSDRARNNAESLSISYDRNEIVSFDQKFIFGNYFIVDFNKDSNLFGGLYYYQKSIRENKIDIGYEPMENIMWHIGGNYKRELFNLNNNINSRGFLNLDKPSNVGFLTEFAQIHPNPNPLGIAYLDDFESSKRYTTIPVVSSAWKMSSPPLNSDNHYFDVDVSIYNRQKINWFNPWQDIYVDYIWPDKIVEDGATHTTLWMEIPYLENQESDWWSGITTPLFTSDFNQTNNKYLDVWLNVKGIPGLENYDEGVFSTGMTEFNLGGKLFLNIDIGDISEDINSNDILDTEDVKTFTDQYGDGIAGNGIFDYDTFAEDVGIDACPNSYEDGWGGCLCDEFNIETYYDECIDNNAQTFTQLYNQGLCSSSSSCYLEVSGEIINCCANPNDPNDDLFAYNQDSPFNFDNYNGTEDNHTQNSYPDTEDNNRDTSLDNISSYFSYKIDLINGETESDITQTGWSLYRIPLRNFEATDEDVSWEEVTSVRLWIECDGCNLSDETILGNRPKIGIASMEIVGNEWEELGKVTNTDISSSGYLVDDFIEDENFSLQLINSEENPSDYVSPPGVSGNVYNTTGSSGANQKIVEKEQSLVIDFSEVVNNFEGGIAGNSSAFIKKNFNFSSLDSDKQNSFFAYENMELWFNALEKENTHGTWYNDGVDLCYRLGKDDNYYELRVPFKNSTDTYEGWQNLKINLDNLTRYKLNKDNLESFEDNGIDQCIDIYETGYLNNSAYLSCLPEEYHSLGITTKKICNTYILNSQIEILSDSQFDFCESNNCLSLINTIDISNPGICTDDTSDNANYNYQANINDPNGDNYNLSQNECNQGLIDNCIPVCCELGTNDCIPDGDSASLASLDFYCSDATVSTQGNGVYDCFEIMGDGDGCDSEDTEIIGELVTNELSSNADGILNIPGSYNDEDDVWEWRNYCDENNDSIQNDTENLNQQSCIDSGFNWIDLDISNICSECSELRIKGEPAINRIEYAMVGIVNNNSQTIYGSVWLNELRMTGVKREPANAFLLSANFNLGELFDINVMYKEQEANFHKLEQRLGSGNNSKSYSMSLGFKPNELLKDDYFELPLDINYSKSISSPLHKPGSDVVLNSIDNTPEYLQTLKDNASLNTYFKTNLSDYFTDNLFYKYFLDNSKLSYAYSWSKLSDPTIRNRENISQKYTYTYNLKFGKNNYWQPFKEIFENEKWQYSAEFFPISYLKDIKIFYTPGDIDFSSMLLNQDNFTLKRENYGGTITDEKNLDLHRKFKTNIIISENFSFNYNIDMKNNLNNYIDSGKSPTMSDIFDLTHSPGLKKNLVEKFSFTYTPNVFDWLSPRFSYVPSYTWSRDIVTNDSPTADLKSDNKFTATFTFSFQKFIEQFYTDGSNSQSRRTTQSYSRSRRRTSSRSNTKKADKIFEIDQPHFKTILGFLHNITERVSGINITYSYLTQNIYNNVSADISPDYNFKLGLVKDPIEQGSLTNSNSTAIFSTSNVFKQEIKFNTSVQITNNLTLSNMEYRISLSANRQSDTGYNETFTQSFFPTGADGSEGIPLFGWSVNLRGLEQIPIIDRWFKSFTINHTYSGEKNDISLESLSQKTDYKKNFTPMIGFKMKTKNVPLDINLTYNNTLTIINEGSQTERKTSQQVNVKFNYLTKTGFRLPIAFLRDAFLENDVNVGVTLGWEKSFTYFSYIETNNLADFEITAYSNSYNIKPEVSFNLSKFVDGDIWANYIVTDNHTTGKRTETDLGFRVRIYFESF